MPLLRAEPVMLSAGERTTLKKRVQGAKTAYRDRLRAQIVLAAARGRGNARIAHDLGISQDTARKWRCRFAVRGLGGLADLPRPGRPRRIGELDRAAVVALACQLPAAWSQAIAANETPSTALIQAKQATYTGIATSMQHNNPAIYPLFQGNQWTTRLEIAFAAMFAALVAGLLILLIALTLIVLKLGFLLLLVAGPFFLIVGTHPGFGRVIAIRWFEMLVGVLMKQAAIAIVLSVLLYCYSLIMGTADAVLPWALKILMISLVTVAVFIYRKPFSHLFSAAVSPSPSLAGPPRPSQRRSRHPPWRPRPQRLGG